MRSILRKCAAGAVLVGGVLLVQPGNFADAATNSGARDAILKCVNAGQKARAAAERQFRLDIKAARALPAEQQRAAVQAAQAKFQAAAQPARDAFAACVAAAKAG